MKCIVWIPAFAGMTATVWAGTGRSGAILLQVPVGARPFALGQAYAALGDDIFGMNYNPAALTRMKKSQAATQYIQSLEDTRLGYFGIGSPLNPNNALGLGIAYLDAGKIDQYDLSGNISGSMNAERDFLAQLGYSHSFAFEGGRLHLGAAGKAFKSVLVEQAQTTAFAADAGTIWEQRLNGGVATAGLSLTNLGPSTKYTGGLASGSEADPLPMTIRAALGYSQNLFDSDAIAAGAQIDRQMGDSKLFESFGLEYNYHRLASLRLGYRLGQDTGGLTLGMGLSFKDISLDYGFGLMQTFSNVQQVSILYRFEIPGIRYSEAAPPSPLETMVKQAHAAVQDRRLFDALAEVERIENFFPDSGQSVPLRQEIDRQAERLLITQPMTSNTLDANSRTAGYAYALGFKKFAAGDWREAVDNLEAARRKESDNREIQKALAKAKSNLSAQQQQQKLRNQARTGTLFELANTAYESSDYARAEKILAEILRLGPYQPADSLEKKIAAAKAAPKPRLAPPVKPAPKPLSQGESRVRQPSAADIARADDLFGEAMRSYSEGRLESALRLMRQARTLNPGNELIRNFLDSVERESRQKL